MNGLDERTNQTLVHTLQKLLTSDNDWDLKIDAALLYAYRISVHDSTKFSPFFLMFNRHPRMAVDHRTATSNEEHNKQHECSLSYQFYIRLFLTITFLNLNITFVIVACLICRISWELYWI